MIFFFLNLCVIGWDYLEQRITTTKKLILSAKWHEVIMNLIVKKTKNKIPQLYCDNLARKCLLLLFLPVLLT